MHKLFDLYMSSGKPIIIPEPVEPGDNQKRDM